MPKKKMVDVEDEDSDFEDSINNNKLRTAPSPVKKRKSKPKPSQKPQVKKAKRQGGIKGQDQEETEMVWTCPPVIKSRVKRFNMKNSLVTLLSGYNSGLVKRSQYALAAVRPVIENISTMRVAQLVSPFDRRVTAIAWHPSRPYLAAAGSKVTNRIDL